ncbi:MAG TPA: hypothetical protein VKA26_13430 [Ignavibacteriaceae bacterium]|nr:hypothetical protein [Ignavibacteriaceae bacterium]
MFNTTDKTGNEPLERDKIKRVFNADISEEEFMHSDERVIEKKGFQEKTDNTRKQLNDRKDNISLEGIKMSSLFEKNGLEEEIDRYVEGATKKINFSLILKPAIISIIALVISFFMDISSVPILGNITVDISKSLFPGWQPAVQSFEPFRFWWLPLLVYSLFVFLAYLAYQKLILEIKRNPASETIDRVITSYTSVIDSISTALPLLGAALLLISIKLGEEVFLGLSVPFEIKALIILALGKLFEPVLDQLGVEFQNIATHVSDLKERYFSRIQTENSKNILSKLTGVHNKNQSGEVSIRDLEIYTSILERTSSLSAVMLQNFKSSHELLERISKLPALNSENIQNINTMADSITTAAKSLSDEKTIAGLKHLESIVKK